MIVLVSQKLVLTKKVFHELFWSGDIEDVETPMQFSMVTFMALLS